MVNTYLLQQRASKHLALAVFRGISPRVQQLFVVVRRPKRVKP